MNEYTTVKEKYTGGWKYVEDDCQLCRMEKITEWHLETQDFVICDKPQGGVMIVSKWHESELSDSRWQRAERIAALLFEDFDFQVIMAHCENHWHAHLVHEGTTRDMTKENIRNS